MWSNKYAKSKSYNSYLYISYILRLQHVYHFFGIDECLTIPSNYWVHSISITFYYSLYSAPSNFFYDNQYFNIKKNRSSTLYFSTLSSRIFHYTEFFSTLTYTRFMLYSVFWHLKVSHNILTLSCMSAINTKFCDFCFCTRCCDYIRYLS